MWKEKDIKYSTHHIVPKSQYWTSDKKNLIELRDSTHRAIHTLFENKLIAEQLITTVNISSKALRPEVRERLLETLTANDPYDLDFWYKPQTHK